MQSIVPAIWFDQNAQEAFELYTKVFPGSSVRKFSPIVAEANLCGVNFVGINGGPKFTPNPSISFMVTCETKEEINTIWNQLYEGGTALMPLDSYPWSAYYGWINDRFGVSWQLYMGTLRDVNQQRITPTLMYCGAQQGKCRAAVDFYQTLFKDFQSQGVLDYPEGDMKGQVQHTQFIANGCTLMAMDSGVPQSFTFNEGISLTILCSNQEEIDYYWNKITASGEESMCGWCKDAFGVSWQIVPQNIEQYMESPASVQVLMQMKKIIIRDLQQA